MATERRQHRTPFSVISSTLIDAAGEIVAVFDNPALATFVARACNRYDQLMAAFDLCRGHMNGITIQPHTSPALIAFHTLADALMDEIQKNGR